MKTLVYKRTHRGDPGAEGCFGIHDCMKSVRARDFDAVIGVGGKGSEPRTHGIAEKLTWIGLGAQKTYPAGRKRPILTFENFVLYDDKGENIRELAPTLADHLLEGNARVLQNFTQAEQEEVNKILDMAKNEPPSVPLNHLPEIPNDGGCSCRSHGRANLRAGQKHRGCSP